MINGFLLSDEDAIYHWPEIEKFLKPVVEIASGETNLECMLWSIETGQNKIIGIFDDDKLICACMLTVIVYPTGKRTLQVPFLGGERIDEWLPQIWAMIKDICKNMGCSHIRVCGRAGWERKMKPIEPDFTKIYTTYETEV